MNIYIKATGNISPQKTFGPPPFLSDLVEYQGSRMACIEPDYKDYIDPKLIRRMSRIIKMGVAAASHCLREAAIEQPDAILTGTAYGCLEDTGLFLSKMVEQNEELLTPTAFIQSTHNTVGAQIALMLHCHQYNNTFVHRGFSFESALLDGLMLLREQEANHVLVGGVDEITRYSHTILGRFGLYKRENISNKDLLYSATKGSMAGEGASFFVLSSQASENDYCQLQGLHTFYKPAGIQEIENQIRTFLAEHSVDLDEIDLILNGRNGDSTGDQVYQGLEQGIFQDRSSASYKNLCGEYPTSTAFALWLAAGILKTGNIPPSLPIGARPAKKIQKILIYNHSQQIHHSLFLLSSC